MSEHYTDGRRWSYISQAWIFADGWNDREEIARLEAKVRELEERLVDYDAAASECEGQSVLTTLRALKQYGMQLEREKADLEAKLRQVAQWVERESCGASLPSDPIEAIILIADERGKQVDRLNEKLRYRAASEPTGTLRVTVEQLNDIHTEYRKLLARLERVERELRVMQCGAQEARSLNKQPG